MKTLFTTLLLLTSALFITAQTSERDKNFMEEALQSGLLEIKLGELAQARASSAEVKELGQRMLSDHSKANSQLMALANRNNIIIPIILNEKGQKIYDMLAEKNGTAFDKAYADCVISSHKKGFNIYKKETKKGDDIDLKGFASSKLTVLKHHKKMAKDARKAIKMKK